MMPFHGLPELGAYLFMRATLASVHGPAVWGRGGWYVLVAHPPLAHVFECLAEHAQDYIVLRSAVWVSPEPARCIRHVGGDPRPQGFYGRLARLCGFLFTPLFSSYSPASWGGLLTPL